MKKIPDDCWQSCFFFINTFSTCTTILECNVKIKQTFDCYAVQKSPEYMEGLFFWVLYRLADHGGGIVTFLLRVSFMCVIDRCCFEFSLMSIMTIEN